MLEKKKQVNENIILSCELDFNNIINQFYKYSFNINK